MLVSDIVVVWFALRTPGSSEADAKWVIALREGAAAGVKAAERFQTRKIFWLGDFNYQPPEVGPPMDPHQTRRTNWEIVTRELRMKVLNPSRNWMGEGPENDWHMVQRWGTAVRMHRGSTQIDGGRGIDLGVASE